MHFSIESYLCLGMVTSPLHNSIILILGNEFVIDLIKGVKGLHSVIKHDIFLALIKFKSFTTIIESK